MSESERPDGPVILQTLTGPKHSDPSGAIIQSIQEACKQWERMLKEAENFNHPAAPVGVRLALQRIHRLQEHIGQLLNKAEVSQAKFDEHMGNAWWPYFPFNASALVQMIRRVHNRGSDEEALGIIYLVFQPLTRTALNIFGRSPAMQNAIQSIKEIADPRSFSLMKAAFDAGDLDQAISDLEALRARIGKAETRIKELVEKAQVDIYMRPSVDMWAEKRTLHEENLPALRGLYERALIASMAAPIIFGLLFWELFIGFNRPWPNWTIGQSLMLFLFVLVPTFAVISWTRTALRDLRTEESLAIDARQKETMAKTYMALVGDESGNALTDAGDRHIILEALFRSLPGPQSDDSHTHPIETLAQAVANNLRTSR